MEINQEQAPEQSNQQPIPANIDLEALIAVIEARIVENLTQMIERLAQKNGAGS